MLCQNDPVVLPDDMHPDAADLILKLLCKDPNQRLQVSEAKVCENINLAWFVCFRCRELCLQALRAAHSVIFTVWSAACCCARNNYESYESLGGVYSGSECVCLRTDAAVHLEHCRRAAANSPKRLARGSASL